MATDLPAALDLSVLTKKQWALILPLLPQRPCRDRRRGRPPADPVAVLSGILWILRTGAPWKFLPPQRYPAYQTCHRYFQLWVRNGTMRRILVALARDLEERGGYDLSECYIDAMFVPAKKGAIVLALPSVARAARSWQSRTSLLFLSGYPSIVLHRMKASLLTLSSKSAIPATYQND